MKEMKMHDPWIELVALCEGDPSQDRFQAIRAILSTWPDRQNHAEAIALAERLIAHWPTSVKCVDDELLLWPAILKEASWPLVNSLHVTSRVSASSKTVADSQFALVSSPFINQLQELSFGNHFDDKVIQALAQSSWTHNLSALRCNQGKLSDDGIAALATSTLITRLKCLDLAETELSAKSIRIILERIEELPQLTQLGFTISQGAISDTASSCLAKATGIRSLNLTGSDFHGVDPEKIVHFLEQFRQLETLVVDNCFLDDRFLTHLVKSKAAQHLTSLSIQNNQISWSGFWQLLCRWPSVSLRELNLRGNTLEGESQPARGSPQDNCSLRKLDLSESSLQDDQFVRLVHMPQVSKLESLNIADCQLGSLAGPAFRQLFESGTVRELSVGGNRLGSSFGNLIAQEPMSGSLVLLDLNNLALCENEVRFLFAATHLQQLRSLNLTGISLTNHLLESLQECPWLKNVRDLFLGYCGLGDTGVVHLSGQLSSELARVNLMGNEISSEGLHYLLSHAECCCLQELFLDSNPIGDHGVKVLGESPLSRSLRSLSLWQCQIGPAGIAAFASSPYLSRLESDPKFEIANRSAAMPILQSPHLRDILKHRLTFRI